MPPGRWLMGVFGQAFREWLPSLQPIARWRPTSFSQLPRAVDTSAPTVKIKLRSKTGRRGIAASFARKIVYCAYRATRFRSASAAGICRIYGGEGR